MMTQPSTINFSIDQNVGIVQFNRPAVFHSFNKDMILALLEKLEECAHKPEVRAVYITASGKAFCAGQDLSAVLEEQDLDFEKYLEAFYNPLILALRNLPKPVVAAVNGVAAGAGANIALACDVVVASASATFVQAFSKIGLIPDCGGTYFLPRLVGTQKAAALMMLADKVTATEAESMGMIYKYFEDDVFEAESFKLAVKLANMPTKALAATKMLLNKTFDNSLESQLQLEGKSQQESSLTADYKEGVTAFLEKRQPVFKGE